MMSDAQLFTHLLQISLVCILHLLTTDLMPCCSTRSKQVE